MRDARPPRPSARPAPPPASTNRMIEPQAIHTRSYSDATKFWILNCERTATGRRSLRTNRPEPEVTGVSHPALVPNSLVEELMYGYVVWLFYEFKIHDQSNSGVTPKWMARGAGRPRRRPLATPCLDRQFLPWPTTLILYYKAEATPCFSPRPKPAFPY
ncbi:hypothetical protein EVAR_104003_1 [Eumeta japonica]|uniref:Uncharacterized protein n=1 Tax=Eumeta variegata TaxID=151549 RepID=A0A4C1XY23_EUMVA|nr:hypothetical protein EVAR_104003_1 [Eumeta japonica]